MLFARGHPASNQEHGASIGFTVSGGGGWPRGARLVGIDFEVERVRRSIIGQRDLSWWEIDGWRAG